MIDTRCDELIYESLANLLDVSNTKLKSYIMTNIQKYLNLDYYSICLEEFYDYFNISDNSFKIKSITIHHVTTRLNNVDKNSFTIDNLENVLLSKNPLTDLCADNEIIFKKEDGISIYHKNKKVDYEKLPPSLSRIKNRLKNLKDSCVNGFLFAEEMDHAYIGLTGMPEIFSDIMRSIDRQDVQMQYFQNKKCYLVSIDVNVQDFIFDGEPNLNIYTKSNRILKHLINYLCFKTNKNKSYLSFKNPMIRLPDNYNVMPKEIVEIRQIYDFKEIFCY